MTHVVVAAPLACLLAVAAPAADDGSQMRSSFRINYLGYLQHAHKLALYVSDLGGSGSWELLDSRGRDVARGTSQDFVADDFASGDSFFRIDFSSFTGTGSGFRLRVGDRESAPFDISAGSPYGHLADEAFDYFQDHRTGETRFDQFRDSWGNGSVTGPFWNDAGDKGSYPTNTAMAAWLLINVYERYPEANASFGTGTTLYQEVRFGTRLLHEVILPGQKLAVPKLHTNVASWAPCAPHEAGTCLSKPETKATYAVARALAQVARLHLDQRHPEAARKAFASARAALTNAQTEPLTCRGFDAFGGEGGIYPDNDNHSIWREPKSFRDPRFPHRDNTEDDEFAALVEVFLAAEALGEAETSKLLRQVSGHTRFGEISEFWWGAVAATGNLSLLALRPGGVESPARWPWAPTTGPTPTTGTCRPSGRFRA